MKYITGSNKKSKYSAIGHYQPSYLNWDSFVDCFKYLIARIYGNIYKYEDERGRPLRS